MVQVPGTNVTPDEGDQVSHQAVQGYVQRVHDMLRAKLDAFLSPDGPLLPSGDIQAIAAFHRCHAFSDKGAVGAAVQVHLEGLLGSAPVTDPDLGALMQLLQEDRQRGRLPGGATELRLQVLSPLFAESQFAQPHGTGPSCISIALVWYSWMVTASVGAQRLPPATRSGRLNHFMVVRPAAPSQPAKRQKVCRV